MRKSRQALVSALVAPLTAISTPGPAPAQEAGAPVVRPYPRQVYGGPIGQVFDLAQDSRHILYLATVDSGLVHFDGERWRAVEVPSPLPALAVDDQDRIWLAGTNTFGYFAADPLGKLEWHEVSADLPERLRTFSEVWPILIAGDALYFAAREYLIRYRDGRFDAWPGSHDEIFYRSYAFGERLFFARYGVGLLELGEDDELVELGDGELAGSTELNAMFRLEDGSFLIFTREHGVFRFDGETIEPTDGPAVGWLRDHQVQHGCLLPDGRFALATRQGGVGLVTPDLRLEQVIDQATGLTHDSVSVVMVDHENNLWAATDNGVNHILLGSSADGFGRASGLPETSILSLDVHRGDLLVGTSMGLYRGRRDADEDAAGPRFEAVSELETQTWDFLPTPDEVLVATTDGVFEVRFRDAGGVSLHTATKLHSAAALVLMRPSGEENLLLVGISGGIGRLRRENGQWRWAGRVEGVPHDVWNLLEGPDGEILAYLRSIRQIAVLEFRDGLENPPEVFLHQLDGPAGLTRVDGDIVASSDTYALRYAGLAAARDGHAFEADPRLSRLAESASGSILLQDGEGRLWLPTSRGIRLAEGLPGAEGEVALEPVSDQLLSTTSKVFEDPDRPGTYWLATIDGLVRVSPGRNVTTRQAPTTLIRRVVELPTQRLLEAGGTHRGRAGRPDLDFRNSSLRFEFASPTFDQKLEMLYRVRLEGFSPEWTEWSSEDFKEYTTLGEGSYTFTVQAQDAWGAVGPVARWAFRVLPPWYRTPWAFAGYFLGAVLLVLGVVGLRTRRLEGSRSTLEKLVARRTEELAEGKQEVERQAKDLERVNRLLATENEHRRQLEKERAKLQERTEQSQKLESLGMMAGGIAHDFNNILMAILGNADLCLDEPELRESLERRLGAISEAGRRAAELCQQMLAYAGKGQLEERELDLTELTRDTLEILRVSIGENVTVETDLEPRPPAVLGDSTKISQLVMNLLSNSSEAIGGRPGSLKLRTGVRHLDADAQERLVLADPIPEGPYVFVRVEDDGEGMDEETRRRIFDPFFTTRFAGRGLGLAATLGILRSHGGAISVQSALGEGTTIEVYFPALDHSVDQAESRTPESVRRWRAAGTVLVVDDESIVRDVVALMLRNTGFDVLTASSGQEALEIFGRERSRISLVVLDLTMPGLDGVATFERLQMLDPSVKVLLSSGYSGDTLVERYLEQGFAGFIAKPYKATTLRQKLRQILDS